MGICVTVKDLAEAIEKTKPVLLSNHGLQIDLLRQMQQYADAKDLGEWEARFQRTVDDEDDQTEVGSLLVALFEFARFNLYGAFRQVETNHEYETLKNLFSIHGVRIDAIHDNEDW